MCKIFFHFVLHFIEMQNRQRWKAGRVKAIESSFLGSVVDFHSFSLSVDSSGPIRWRSKPSCNTRRWFLVVFDGCLATSIRTECRLRSKALSETFRCLRCSFPPPCAPSRRLRLIQSFRSPLKKRNGRSEEFRNEKSLQHRLHDFLTGCGLFASMMAALTWGMQ